MIELDALADRLGDVDPDAGCDHEVVEQAGSDQVLCLDCGAQVSLL